MNTETIERIQLIKSEIYRFFESEIMWDSLDEYLLSVDLVELIAKLKESYGFASEMEEAVASTIQDDNVRRFIWIGSQRIEMSGYKTLRFMADAITAAITEEIDIVNQESSYYRELLPDYLEWTCRGEQTNTFLEMISAVSRNRFCDVAFAGLLRNTGFVVGKADYCGCGDTYYVEAREGQRIWFDDVIVKNENTPERHHLPRIEILQAMVDEKFQKTI